VRVPGVASGLRVAEWLSVPVTPQGATGRRAWLLANTCVHQMTVQWLSVGYLRTGGALARVCMYVCMYAVPGLLRRAGPFSWEIVPKWGTLGRAQDRPSAASRSDVLDEGWPSTFVFVENIKGISRFWFAQVLSIPFVRF